MTQREQFLAALAGWGFDPATCHQLTGDVSPRHYYRLQRPEGGTAVVMVTPLERRVQLDDWLAVGAWLAKHGVAVPEVYLQDDEHGVLLIEDAGDGLLTTVEDADRADDWYRGTLDRLAGLERAAAADGPEASPAHRRILTEERTHWELRRLRKVVAASVKDLDNDELEGWKEGEDAVVRALADAPKVWMHRDLHARNVLVNGTRSVWIDYQDAMLGPWLYDAVSLLFDPYAALSPARRERLRRHYLAASTPPGRETVDDDALWWLCAVQRLVHCVACYVYVCEHNDNSAYLKYLPYAIEHLREAFERCSLAAPLGQIMASRWTLLADRWCRHGST